MQTVIFYYRICQHADERRQRVHKMSLQEIWFGHICVGSQHCVLYQRAKKTTLCAHTQTHTLSKWLSCKVHAANLSIFSSELRSRWFAVATMPLKCSQLQASRGQDGSDTPIRSSILWLRFWFSSTTAPSLYFADSHFHASPWQNIKLCALYKKELFKKKKKGKCKPNISCWQKYSAHAKVIYRLTNNYSSSKPFVSVWFVVLTKRGGPFITMNGGRHRIFTVLCFSIFSRSQCCRILGLRTVVICGLWFMILWPQKTRSLHV